MNKGNVSLKVLVLSAVLVGLAGFVGGLLFARPAGVGGFSESYIRLFRDTVTFDNEISLGAPICASKTWNPGAVVSSTVATTSLALDSTYEVGDVLLFGLSTSTCAASDAACLLLTVQPTRVASGTEVLAQLAPVGEQTASIDVATATLSVCYLDVP